MHNFKGWMIKVGDRIFPNEYIAINTYNSSPNQRTDQDSYTDGNGMLQRNILPHTRTKVTFSTPDEMHLEDKIIMQSFFNRDETTLTYWNDETNSYREGKFYIADPNFPIKRIIDENDNSDIIYGVINLEIIEY